VLLRGLLASLVAAPNARKSFQSLAAASSFGTLLRLAFPQPGAGAGGAAGPLPGHTEQLVACAQQVLLAGLLPSSQVQGLAEAVQHAAAPQLAHVQQAAQAEGAVPGQQPLCLLPSAPPTTHSYHGTLLVVRRGGAGFVGF
jgi:hypothetical protein